MSQARAAAAAAITDLAGPEMGAHIITCLEAVARLRAEGIAMGIHPDELDVEVAA
jgi:hypothetical protein